VDVIPKGTPVKWSTNLTGQARGQEFKGSSKMLKNYKEQKDMEERHRRNRKNVKGADKVFRKQIFGNPWTLFSN
jgi:hypothetical protein